MTTRQMLTLRTSEAMVRLAALQRRAEKVSGPVNGVVGTALKELSDALEELRTANDELQMQVTELADVRDRAVIVERRFEEFLDVLPVACVWTSASGAIVDANSAAASLLNVSRQHLAGRPLILFLTERAGMLGALSDLGAGVLRAVDFAAAVRPRERRVRKVHVSGRRLDSDDDRLCWFLVEHQAEPGAGAIQNGSSV